MSKKIIRKLNNQKLSLTEKHFLILQNFESENSFFQKFLKTKINTKSLTKYEYNNSLLILSVFKFSHYSKDIIEIISNSGQFNYFIASKCISYFPYESFSFFFKKIVSGDYHYHFILSLIQEFISNYKKDSQKFKKYKEEILDILYQKLETLKPTTRYEAQDIESLIDILVLAIKTIDPNTKYDFEGYSIADYAHLFSIEAGRKYQKLLNILELKNAQESHLARNKRFLDGVFWGESRSGHPEGAIIYHIKEVFDNIDRLNIDKKNKKDLRIIALVHDTFKKESQESNKNHATIAYEYLQEIYPSLKKSIKDIVKLHDDAYKIWKKANEKKDWVKAKEELKELEILLGENIQLYYLFFKCDNATGDKSQESIQWFEKNVNTIERIEFK